MTDIFKYINNTDLLNEDTLPELKDIVERYPYFQTARMLYLINLYNLHHKDFSSELKASSVFIYDRSPLFKMVESARYNLKQTAEHVDGIEIEKNPEKTVMLIDEFLKQSKQKSQPSIADLTHDYTAFLENMDDIQQIGDVETENPTPKLRGSELIDGFLEEAKSKRMEIGDLDDDFVSPELSYEEEEVYTANMVNIYIKQGRYKEALEILHKICLNNPEKSATFAPQIELLEVILAKNKE